MVDKRKPETIQSIVEEAEPILKQLASVDTNHLSKQYQRIYKVLSGVNNHKIDKYITSQKTTAEERLKQKQSDMHKIKTKKDPIEALNNDLKGVQRGAFGSKTINDDIALLYDLDDKKSQIEVLKQALDDITHDSTNLHQSNNIKQIRSALNEALAVVNDPKVQKLANQAQALHEHGKHPSTNIIEDAKQLQDNHAKLFGKVSPFKQPQLEGTRVILEAHLKRLKSLQEDAKICKDHSQTIIDELRENGVDAHSQDHLRLFRELEEIRKYISTISSIHNEIADEALFLQEQINEQNNAELEAEIEQFNEIAASTAYKTLAKLPKAATLKQNNETNNGKPKSEIRQNLELIKPLKQEADKQSQAKGDQNLSARAFDMYIISSKPNPYQSSLSKRRSSSIDEPPQRSARISNASNPEDIDWQQIDNAIDEDEVEIDLQAWQTYQQKLQAFRNTGKASQSKKHQADVKKASPIVEAGQETPQRRQRHSQEQSTNQTSWLKSIKNAVSKAFNWLTDNWLVNQFKRRQTGTTAKVRDSFGGCQAQSSSVKNTDKTQDHGEVRSNPILDYTQGCAYKPEEPQVNPEPEVSKDPQAEDEPRRRFSSQPK